MADHKWIVDVLSDLETYAKNNELNSLRHLSGEARSKAAVEALVDLHEYNRQYPLLSSNRLN